MNTTSSSQPSHSSTILRPLIAAIAVALICIAAGSSRMAQPSFAIDQRRKHHAAGRSAHGELRHARVGRNRHRVDRQFDDPRLVFHQGHLQFGHRVVEHRRPLQLRRRRHEPGHRPRAGLGRVGRHPDGLSCRQADEQHGRHDYVARHQLRGRAVAQRRQRHRPHADLPVSGRRPPASSPAPILPTTGWTTCARAELHGPDHRRRRPRRSTAMRRPTASQIGHARGDGRQRSGDLATVAGSR